MKPERRTSYPPGHFTAGVYENNWPLGFVSQVQTLKQSEVDRREAATRGRETALAKGITGTIKGISNAADAQIDRGRNFNARVKP